MQTMLKLAIEEEMRYVKKKIGIQEGRSIPPNCETTQWSRNEQGKISKINGYMEQTNSSHQSMKQHHPTYPRKR